MANTYTAIATVTVGSGGAANIDFTSIPATYTDLVVKVSCRSTAATDFVTLSLAFNTSTANFTSRLVQGDGSSAVTATSTNFGGGAGGTSTTASTFNNVELYIPNYAGSTNKSYSSDSVVENNATAARNTLIAGLWSQTAAITGVTFSLSSGNFAEHSTATLYGIKNS
jgi:hypothetical protein